MQERRLIPISASKIAGHDFDGTEHDVSFTPALRKSQHTLVEANLRMGSEAKTWAIVKNAADGKQYTLIDSGGAVTTTNVFKNELQLRAIILPGESVGIVTTGATSAMDARLYFEAV